MYYDRLWLCSHPFWLLARTSRIQGIGPTSFSQLAKICAVDVRVCVFFHGMSGRWVREGHWQAWLMMRGPGFGRQPANTRRGDDDESGSGGSWPAEGNSRRARARRVV